MSETNNKVTYKFENKFGKRISDKKFAKTVEQLYNQVVIIVLSGKKMLGNNSKTPKLIECDVVKGEKGKIICNIDARAANEVSPQVVEYLLEKYQALEPLLVSTVKNNLKGLKLKEEHNDGDEDE